MPEYFDQSLDDIIKKGRKNSRRGGTVRAGASRRRGGVTLNTRGAVYKNGGTRRIARGGAVKNTGGHRRSAVSYNVARKSPAFGVRKNTSARWRTLNKTAMSNSGKQKQLATLRTPGNSVNKTRPVALQTKALKTKRLAMLALASKKRALQQLTRANNTLRQTDARNQLLMRRRNMAPAVSTARNTGVMTNRPQKQRGRRTLTRGIQSTRGISSRGRSQRGRGARQLTVAPSGVANMNYSYRGRPSSRRPFRLNRSLLRGDAHYTAVQPSDSMLTVQIKNEPYRSGVQHMSQPAPYDPENAAMDVTKPRINRSALNPRIQQEIAAIQARGRSQRHPAADSVPNNIKPVRASSGRTLNERFTQDRVIY